MNSCEEIDNICRICLLEAVDLRSIFKIGEVCGEFLTLSKMLTECTSIESFPEDGLPQTICMKCIKQLSKMYLFRKKCIKSHSILRERFHQQGDIKPVIIENQDQEEYMDTVYYVDEINANANNNEYQEEQEGNNENTEEVKEDCEYEVHEIEDISAYYHKPDNHHHQQQETQSQQLQQQNSLDTETEITDNNVVFEEIDEGEDQNFEQIELYTVTDDENTTTLKIISMERDENYEVDQNVIAISAEEDSVSIKSGITGSGRGDGCVIDSDIATDSGTNDDRTDHRLSENENQYVKSRIKKHGKNKIPGPPFKCDKCGKILSNRSSYSYHQQLHSDDTPFVCAICGESFKTRNSHMGHMTTHNKFNPHTCKICGKSYRQAGSLKSHMLTHTGEKPFVCNICGKGMTQRSGFKKHMLIHTGEKPFSCEICGKKFRYSSNLIIHRNNHKKRAKQIE